MATPSWVRQALELRGISFEELHHPEVYTAQQVAQCEHTSGHRVAKVVVVIVDGRPIELILPASRHVNLERIRDLKRAQDVRLATEEEIEKYFSDCEVGAIPALRHWQNVDVLMDRSLAVDGKILIQAGTHEDAVRLNYRDWFELVQPQVATFTEPAEPALA
jgi:Ala-tRNA(Pro) deacylase